MQVAEGAVHEAGSELPTGDEEGVNRHQLAPEVGRGGLSDVHWHRHAGDACGERQTQGEEVINRREKRWLSCMIPVSCVTLSLFCISFLNLKCFFSRKHVNNY